MILTQFLTRFTPYLFLLSEASIFKIFFLPLYAPITADECHAWFHLNAASPAARNTEQVKIAKRSCPGKVQNETETKRIETKRNKSKQNEIDRKQIETNLNETKQIEIKRNKRNKSFTFNLNNLFPYRQTKGRIRSLPHMLSPWSHLLKELLRLYTFLLVPLSFSFGSHNFYDLIKIYQ